jgi:hypothetical protein
MFQNITVSFLSGFRRSAQPSNNAEAERLGSWAAEAGFHFHSRSDGYSIQGRSNHGAWSLQAGKSTHWYTGESEIRADGLMAVDPGPTIVLIGRKLKDKIERKSFATATDDLRTGFQDRIPEEVLWLASCNEVGWEGPDEAFWRDWSVLSDKRNHGRLWVGADLQESVMAWAGIDTAPDPALMLVLHNGSLHLRARHSTPECLECAAALFHRACLAAEERFPASVDIPTEP